MENKDPCTPNIKLRKARKRKMWTMEETAELVEVSLVTYSRWERGKQRPHPKTLRKLCDVFKMSEDELGFSDL